MRKISIGQVLVGLITGLALFGLLLYATKCEAWTEHEFQARLSGGNDWKIASLPESIDRSEEYDMAGRLGYLSYVYIVREDGKWDPELMYMGPIAIDKEFQNFAKIHIAAMIKAVDKVMPDEKIVVVSFVVDYVEMSIFFDPERWEDKEFHVKTAKKLNIEREKWIKLAITD